MSRERLRASKFELTVLVAGLVLAVISGIVTYRIVGPYGDGPLSVGYRRMTDPETGRSVLVHESKDAEGRTIRRIIDDRSLQAISMETVVEGQVEEARFELRGTTVSRIDRDRDRDGRVDLVEYYDLGGNLVKTGFSLVGDGVIDAWAFRDDRGQLVKIEVSTRRDTTVDRWEYYRDGQLTRVEQDTNRDGRVDRWSLYEAGILMQTIDDANRDGRPDSAVPPR